MDARALERILSPWSGVSPGSAVEIVDAQGARLAGRAVTRDREPSDGLVRADIVVDGVLVGRVMASGGAGDGTELRAAVEALAIAIGEWAGERHAREAAERALEAHRAQGVANSLGIDVAELAKGRRQQRSIVTLEAPVVPGYELASYYAAAREIGGDFFELFRIPRRANPLGIVVADVTGKGLDAALLMAFARPVLHTALCNAPGPSDALSRTNRVLVGEHRGTLFITALACVLHPPSGRVRIASAGHEAPLLIPVDGRPVTEVGRAGVLLGAWDRIASPETEITLEPGDMLVCYTDGVTDTVAPSGERFGDERLLATLEAARGGSPAEMVASVRDHVLAFRGSAEPADDVTLVAVGRTPRRRRSRTQGRGLGAAPDADRADAIRMAAGPV
jgi:serine phosphatase RsbU (regulator of sigma subunit)